MNSFIAGQEESFQLNFESTEVENVAIVQEGEKWQYFSSDSKGNWDCFIKVAKKPLHIVVRLKNDPPDYFRDIIGYL